MSLSFKPELMEKVLSGDKTVTRRKWPTNYKPGQIVSIVPGMGRIACGKVEIVSVSKSNVIEGATEAQAEGFDSGTEFVAYWKTIHGSVDRNMPTARIEFKLIEITRTICECCEGIGTLINPQPNSPKGE